MTMRLTWPAYRAGLVSHTVKVGNHMVAGYLVRDLASRRELGYVWQAGSSWQWRVDDKRYGERSSQEAAIRQLRDIADVGRAQPPLPFDDVDDIAAQTLRDRAAARRATKTAAPAAPAAPAAAPQPRVTWTNSNSADLTAAIKQRLDKQK